MARTYDVKAAAAELRRRCREEQGLPEYIENPLILDELATIFDGARHTREAS